MKRANHCVGGDFLGSLEIVGNDISVAGNLDQDDVRYKMLLTHAYVATYQTPDIRKLVDSSRDCAHIDFCSVENGPQVDKFFEIRRSRVEVLLGCDSVFAQSCAKDVIMGILWWWWQQSTYHFSS